MPFIIPPSLLGLLYIAWFILGAYAYYLFLRAMRALVQIPERLERLELALLAQKARDTLDFEMRVSGER